MVDSGGDRENISDEIVQKFLKKRLNQEENQFKSFEKEGRRDLADLEKAQLEALLKYMPAQLSDEELKAIINKVKTENPNIKGVALMGKIIPLVKGKADPARIKDLI